MTTRLLRRLRVALIRRLCTVRPPMLPSARRAELAAERQARDIAGLPGRHPERMYRPLRERYEERLAALAAELWPNDEYESELHDEGGTA